LQKGGGTVSSDEKGSLSCLAAALSYARQGWPVLPLKARGKRPLTGHGLKDASTDPAQIGTWWNRWPDANVGVGTGEASGFIVLDLDRRGQTDGAHVAHALWGFAPEDGPCVRTGNGMHCLFKHPGFTVKNRTGGRALADGVEVKGEDGYVVAPPSVHPNGRRYEWIVEPDDELPECPGWLLTELRDSVKPEGQGNGQIALSVVDRIPEGQRNARLASMAGGMRRGGMSSEAIRAALLVENERCDPPLRDAEVERIAKSISRYSPGDALHEAVTQGKYRTAATFFPEWREDVLRGKPPERYRIGEGELGRIEVGPGLITLIGGPPGVGKTALTVQAAVDALRLTPQLRAVVCNVETAPEVLLERQLARLSGVDLTTIRYRQLRAEHTERVQTGLNTLAKVVERLYFVSPPFDLRNIAATAGELGCSLIVLDYVQRIAAPGVCGDARSAVNAAMNSIRELADRGAAVILVSALGRGKDKWGQNSYDDGLSLASFRESSELEYSADSAFILAPDTNGADGDVVLMHLKERHGETRGVFLRFDGAHQSFTAREDTQRSRK